MVGHGTLDDVAHMTRALALAERGRGRTSPNPMVGAVVVDDEGVIVGRGAHERAGGPTPRLLRWPTRALVPAARPSIARSSRARIPAERGRARRAWSKLASAGR